MIPNTPLYRTFVDPNLCVKLLQAGLTAKSSFLWVYARKGAVQLYCSSLDPDGVTYQGISNIAFVDDETPNPYAAFQIADMEAILQNFFVEKVLNRYHIMVDQLWGTEPIEAERLPDAFALMVLALIEKGKIEVTNAIKLINQ